MVSRWAIRCRKSGLQESEADASWLSRRVMECRGEAFRRSSLEFGHAVASSVSRCLLRVSRDDPTSFLGYALVGGCRRVWREEWREVCGAGIGYGWVGGG